MTGNDRVLSTLKTELRKHAPFTIGGAVSGVAIAIVLITCDVPRSTSVTLFWSFHPLHVLLSALATAGMYRRHGRGGLGATIVIAFVGSIGIATFSDSIIPYLGEAMLGLPNRGIHLGFIERWWLVNPLAFLGIAIACVWPATEFPHAGHVLLSTWASLFHMSMALGQSVDIVTLVAMLVFLFLAVWLPCCTSDIIFPLLFSKVPSKDPPAS